MFWDKVAPAYDLFETVYNAKVYRNTGERVASEISEKAVKILEKMGASFERQFDTESYKVFFEDAGFSDVEYDIVDGRMPCMIAILMKR